MDNTPQKKQYNLYVIQFISSCNKCRILFWLWFWQVIRWDATAIRLSVRAAQNMSTQRQGLFWAFQTSGSQAGWCSGIPPKHWFGGRGGVCQAPHHAGVPHISLLSSSRVQPTKQTPLKSASGIKSAFHLWASTDLEAAVYLVCSSVRLNKKPETKQLSFFMEWDKENNRCFH